VPTQGGKEKSPSNKGLGKRGWGHTPSGGVDANKEKDFENEEMGKHQRVKLEGENLKRRARQGGGGEYRKR